MKTSIQIRNILHPIAVMAVVLLMQFSNSFAEGTKQLMPTSASFGNLEIYDMKRPFAAYYNNDPMNRLYFHISKTSEKVYFGFNHIVKTGINNSTTQFIIKDPSGNIVNSGTVPTTGNGYISTYSKAVAGPKIGGLPSGGYTPLSYSPITTGDFYIEFQTDTTQGTYYLDYFDLSVVLSGHTPLLGRLWSYCWDISTRTFDNGFDAKMYVLTDDGYVSEVNFNGIQAFGFTVACNSIGPGNLTGGNNENRKSLSGNHTRPQYKIFLNDPDINAYPSGSLPQIVQNLNVIGTPTYGKPVLFTVNISQAGIVQIVLDINGIPGYQPNSADVILVEPVHSGLDSITWDGKDGFGNFVIGNTDVLVLSNFASGTTHLPLYDPETHPNGYIVNRIRPSTGQCDLFWDDSNFSGGTVSIDGSLTTGHSWTYFFGDVRTMNTWWNGYQLNVLNNFEFSIGTLPVEFIWVEATTDNNDVDISWKTASETNNDFFTIERSNDGITFETLATENGAGYSNSILTYNFKDIDPMTGVNFYRIKQTDFDGKSAYSEIKAVKMSPGETGFTMFPNPVTSGENLQVVPINSADEYTVVILSANGQKFSDYTANGSSSVAIDESLPKGVYYVFVSMKTEKHIEKIVVQ